MTGNRSEPSPPPGMAPVALTFCLDRLADYVLFTEAEPIDLPGPRIVYVNEAVLHKTGYTREELYGATPRILQGPGTDRDTLHRVHAAMRAWQPIRVELLNYTRSGEEFWIEMDLAPAADANGWYTHWVSISRDITVRKRAEQARAELERLAHTTLDAMPLPICVLDMQGVIRAANSAWKSFGEAQGVGAGIGAPYLSLCRTTTPGEAGDRNVYEERLLQALAGSLSEFEQEFLCMSFAEQHWFLAHVVRFEQAGEPRVVVIHRDIHSRKLAQQREVRQAEIMRMLAERATLPEILAALAADIEASHPGMVCSVLLLDEGGSHLRHGAAPSLPAFYNEAMDGVAIGPMVGSCGAATALGQRVIATDIEQDQRWVDYREVAARAGLRACWAEPVKGRGGEVLGSFAIYHRVPNAPNQSDIETIESAARVASIAIERLRAEAALHEMQARTRDSQRLESLGQLAGGIAHDFNNVLSIILGNLALAHRDVPASSSLHERLDQMEIAAERAVALVRQILMFNRRVPARFEALDIAAVVAEAVSLLRPTLGAGIEFVQDVATGLLPVAADPTQLHQVLVNLCTNAARAIEAGSNRPGHISLSARPVTLNAARASGLQAGLAPGEYVLLSVGDNGLGMDAAVRARIFEPFFTTRAAGEGTGLGLSVVHGIVASHHGAVAVDSRPGQGTRFDIYLPASADAPALAMAATAGVPAAGVARGGHVLYVDDESQLVTLARDVLAGAGYEFSGYTDPRAALAALGAAPGTFDLLVSDVSMPSMSGLEFARAARSICPSLPIVLVSGYVTPELTGEAARAGVRRVIEKPDLAATLRATVAALRE